ncbi:mannose-specific lectin-like [Typha latifolia]|uniref:mannose-specific lectin-like n=1 Tax=Typha latifolia TaxID=4733 RepID=UPI003C302564
MATSSTCPLSLASLPILLAILALLAAPCSASNVLFSGNTLTAGESLTQGSYTFIIQNDCNLVLYDSGKAVWASGTSGQGAGCRLDMQSDGNLVIYNRNNNPVWASNTNIGQGSYYLVLQSDRNAVIYATKGAIWATGTNIRGTADVVIISKNSTAHAVVADAAAGLN